MSFKVVVDGRDLGFVQERSEGVWRAYTSSRKMIGDFARPADARQAVAAAALRNVGGEA